MIPDRTVEEWCAVALYFGQLAEVEDRTASRLRRLGDEETGDEWAIRAAKHRRLAGKCWVWAEEHK